ncbi:hypothetical protein A2U01_0111581, partial [Trifolium medium]|nr:hypothetical protein [Trifolium medium]
MSGELEKSEASAM